MRCARWILLLVAIAMIPMAAKAQGSKKESQLRTVRGAVLDKDENTLPAATVYLKNLKTQTVMTHFSDDAGQYRFSGLDPNVDYQLHAEHNDLTSANRTASRFDSRKEIVIHLKVDKKKAEK